MTSLVRFRHVRAAAAAAAAARPPARCKHRFITRLTFLKAPHQHSSIIVMLLKLGVLGPRMYQPSLQLRACRLVHSAWIPHTTTRPLSMSVEPNGGQLLGPDPIEEETLRGYKAEHYYPVEIGQTFQSRYKAVGKLGYGSASTVWLCRDLRAKESYVALKVYINCSKEHRELSICQRINSVSSEHRGRVSIRKLLDSFEVEGPHGRHACLAFEPLGNSLGDLKLLADGILKAEVIRETMRPILSALHFLHTVAHVVHTGW